MGNINILMYGGGNCEIGGQLGEAFETIDHIASGKNVKVFGRAHVFNKSCLNIYGRFEEIKQYIDLGNNSGQGGIYEYFYNGNQTIKMCEMKIQPVTDESFEEFLTMGKERLGSGEVVLILMGQGNLKGMFMDFALEEPNVLEYEKIFKYIRDVLYPNFSRIHLVIDMACWHYIRLPLLLLKYPFFKSVFIYKRPQAYKLFPIATFIQGLEQLEVYGSLRQKEISGYWIDLSSQKAFEKVYMLWQAYKKQKIDVSMLVKYYTQVVIAIHGSCIGEKAFEKLSQIDGKEGFNEVEDYFRLEYGIIVDEQNLNEWLESLKICTDYHKL